MTVLTTRINRRHLCIAIFLHTILSTAAQAQSIVLAFPDNGTEIRGDVASNAAAIASLETIIKDIQNNPSLQIARIRITAYSSIDGDYASNEAISRERAEQTLQWMRQRYPSIANRPCDVAWVAEDWTTLSALLETSNIDEKMEIQHIIRQVRVMDDRERLIRTLNNGSAFAQLQHSIFPRLRRVTIDIETEQADKPQTSTAEALDPIIYNVIDQNNPDPRDNRSLAVATPRVLFYESEYLMRPIPVKRYTRWAVKTNLLQWAGIQRDASLTTTMANVAVEYYFRPQWSVEAGMIYSYWYYKNKERFQGTSGYRIELRRHQPVIKHRLDAFVGLYGRVGDYDIRQQWNTINHTGNYWDTGLSAGLTIPIISGWCVEAGLRAGYLNAEVIEYEKEGNRNWFVSERKKNELMITELNISAVWKF